MSSSPRSNATRTAIFALSVGAAIIVVSLLLLAFGVDVLKIGDTFVTGLFPPIAVTSQGAQIRDLYTVVFLIAVAIFIVVEGLIIWTVIRYRRKPGDDTLPPQTHGNNVAEFVWTVVPTLIVIFMFVVSWQTLNAVDTNASDANTTKIRAVAGQFQWQFDYLDQNDKRPLHRVHPARQRGRRDDGPGRPDRPALARQQGRHPRLLRPAVPVQARRRAGSDQPVRLHGRCSRCGPDVPRPVRRAVRDRATASCCSRSRRWRRPTSTRGSPARPPRIRQRRRRRQRRARTERPAQRRPRAVARPRRAPVQRPTIQLDRERRRCTTEKTLTAPAGAPFQIDFDNQDAGVAAQRHDPQGLADGRAGLRGRDLPGRRHEDLRRAGPGRRDLLVRVRRPSDDDDRHADGPVRSARWRRPR